MKKRFALLLALCFVMSALCVPVFANADSEPFVEGEAAGEYDGSIFAAGRETGSSANIRGLLLTAGYTVTANGRSEYALAAGYDVELAGEVENDAFTAGNDIRVSGIVARDLFAGGRYVKISGEVGRNAYVAANTVLIDGAVKGELFVSAENIIIDDAAEVGALHFNAGANVSAPADILSSADTYESETETETETAEITVVEVPAESFGRKLANALISFLGVAALAFVMLWLTPLWEKLDAKYYGVSFGEYAKAFGIGFAVLAALPLAAVILLITRIGVRLAIVLLFAYAAALAASPVFISFFVGSVIWRRAFNKPANYFAELPIGALVWRVAVSVPVLGFAVTLISAALGLGVITLLLGKKKPQSLPTPEQTAAE